MALIFLYVSCIDNFTPPGFKIFDLQAGATITPLGPLSKLKTTVYMHMLVELWFNSIKKLAHVYSRYPCENPLLKGVFKAG